MSSRLGLLFMFIKLTFILQSENGSAAKPLCPRKCGNISIPYPFGIGENCYRNKWFEITCRNQSSNMPVPILNAYQLKVLEITFSRIRVAYSWNFSYLRTEYGLEQLIKPIHYEKGTFNPFIFSHSHNKFVGIGCDTFSLITNPSYINYTTGCLSLCQRPTLWYQIVVQPPFCSGVFCCQTSLPVGLQIFRVQIFCINTGNGSSGPSWPSWVIPPARAFLAENDFSDFFSNNPEVPVSLTWVVGYGSCAENLRPGNTNNSDYACGKNAECVEYEQGQGYSCNCSRGYQGNAYLPDGCQDIEECKLSNELCTEGAQCINTRGGYYCSCPTGFHGDGTRQNGCIHDEPAISLAIVVALGIGAGISLAVILTSAILCAWGLRKQRQAKLRKMFFKRNGGLLLQQQIASQKVSVGKTRIFVTEELERATDNFSASRIHGRGGFGSLYKGMLSDGQVVGIKKARVVDENQVVQFINEVVILSQINHRNIVKLIGCCLETEVPLLVFEFVSNGTLSHHLHDKGHVSSLSWELRFRISLDIAGALAYLHSAACTSIFHRDVKSTNILLDEKFRAIVADFGLSRSVPIDRTHLTTQVHGTFGYIDPEYFQSSQFTEKSDVYSFGVVLVELLTGERAVSSTKFEEDKSLVGHFISAVKENRVKHILEARVSVEADEEEVFKFTKLARRCLKLNGKKRPTMKEVVIELEKIRNL